jgi:hypothetical protein
MLDMRRRELAEGERRIIGSERLEAGVMGFDVLGAGREVREDLLVGAEGRGAPFDRRPRNVSACLRTCEKSFRQISMDRR